MADASTYDHRDPYAHAYGYFQYQHHYQPFSQRPLALSSSPGALMSYSSFQTPPSPLHTSPSTSDFWYPSYPSHYGQFPPTPTSPLSPFSSPHYPSYPPTPTGGRASGLPDLPDYLVHSRDAYSSSVPRGGLYDLRAPQPSRVRIRKAAPKAIQDLYSMRLSDLPEDERSCNICMEPYVEAKHSADQPKREHALRMPCGHVFGSFCIKQWLQTHNTCPACRTELDYIEVEEEDSPSRSRRRSSLSTHESIVNDLFGEPYRDPVNRSKTPHQPTRSRSYFGNYEPEPRPGTTAPTSSRPSMRRAQTLMGQGSSQLPYFQFGQPPSPGLNRHASQARMQGIREQPYPRPGSSSSSAAATTQSEPTRSSNGHYSQPSSSRGTSFRRPDLRCALEALGLCDYDTSESRSYTRLVRLDCGHGYHADCLYRTMKSKTNGADLSARLIWCERCRKYLERKSFE